jgi:hypothetical protein
MSLSAEIQLIALLARVHVGVTGFVFVLGGLRTDITCPEIDPASPLQFVVNAAAGSNERVFLVNASLGLYPELLEAREAYKERFGRSRWVAFWAASATLLRAQRKLRLSIEQGEVAREVRAPTLFAGHNP